MFVRHDSCLLHLTFAVDRSFRDAVIQMGGDELNLRSVNASLETAFAAFDKDLQRIAAFLCFDKSVVTTIIKKAHKQEL